MWYVFLWEAARSQEARVGLAKAPFLRFAPRLQNDRVGPVFFHMRKTMLLTKSWFIDPLGVGSGSIKASGGVESSSIKASGGFEGVIGSALFYFLQTWCIIEKGPVFVAMFHPLALLFVGIFSAIVRVCRKASFWISSDIVAVFVTFIGFNACNVLGKF